MTLKPALRETAILAAGCFWGVEEALRRLPGVSETEVGYTDGHHDAPSYEDVCYRDTGHAEAVRLTFDPSRLSYEGLLEVFFDIHDPTQLNRQGPDIGAQYRSAIFVASEAQRATAQGVINRLDASGRYAKPVATVIRPEAPWWPAEACHQKYFMKRGGGSCHIPGQNRL